MEDHRRNALLQATRDENHTDCVVCGQDRPDGLALAFEASGEGGVTAEFACDPRWEGYPGYVHGGIVSSLLDGAMTNCLFAEGRVCLTAELVVRYRAPLLLGKPAFVSARIERATPRLQTLTAEVRQDGTVVAAARGKFLAHPDAAQS